MCYIDDINNNENETVQENNLTETLAQEVVIMSDDEDLEPCEIISIRLPNAKYSMLICIAFTIKMRVIHILNYLQQNKKLSPFVLPY